MRSSVEITADGRALWPERSELRLRLLEDAAGDDMFRLRCDAVRAADLLELLTQPEPSSGELPRRKPRASTVRTAVLAVVVGIVAGLLLALLLARTAFAPAFRCHPYAENSFTCTRTGG